MVDKLYSFTKNEAYFLKKILPTCKLTAYQIPLFQSVMEALDSPIKPKPVTNLQPVDLSTSPGPQVFANIDKTQTHTSDFFKSPGLTKQIDIPPVVEEVQVVDSPQEPEPVLLSEEIIDLEQPIETQPPVTVTDIDSAGMFDTIDNRSK